MQPQWSFVQFLMPQRGGSNSEFSAWYLLFRQSPRSTSWDLQRGRKWRHPRQSLYLFIYSCHQQLCLLFQEQKPAGIPYFPESARQTLSLPYLPKINSRHLPHQAGDLFDPPQHPGSAQPKLVWAWCLWHTNLYQRSLSSLCFLLAPASIQLLSESLRTPLILTCTTGDAILIQRNV